MRILLVVDLQKEFSANCKSKYDEIIEWVINHSNEYDSVVATRFVNKPNSPYVRYLNWNKMQSVQDLEFKYDTIIDKCSYGLQDYSWIPEKCSIDIVGMDTDACVLKIALDLFDIGKDFKVLSKLCWSSGGEHAHNNAVALMRRQLGDGIQ